jgi:hypothetical protein
MNRPYPKEKIPKWCMMNDIEHCSVGGCWSILFDQIIENCPTCEDSVMNITVSAETGNKEDVDRLRLIKTGK